MMATNCSTPLFIYMYTEDLMKTIEERIDGLKTLSQEERALLAADLDEAFTAAEESDDLDRMEALLFNIQQVENFEHLVADVNSSVADVEDIVPDVVEAAAPVEEAPVETAPVEVPAVEAAAPAVEPVAETPETPAPAQAEQEQELAMAASLVTAIDDVVDTNVVADAPIVAAAPAIRELNPLAPLTASIASTPTAGTDITGIPVGTPLTSTYAIDEATVKMIAAMRGTHGGDGEQRAIVTMRADFSDDRQLSFSDVLSNMEKIEKVTALQPILASGGYCAPLPVNYDIYGVGTNMRPVRDSLPTFGATRGGIRYIQPPKLGSYTSAIALWTAANDASPSSPATKPFLQITCASEETATTSAVTLSLVFGNLMSRAYPELVQRHNQLALVQHARFAEQTLLNSIAANSTAVTTSYVSGYGRDLLRAIAEASAAYRNRNRVPRGIPLRAIMPEWALDAMREDIAASTHFEDLAAADTVINSWLSARNINITWHMDDTFSSQSASAPLNAFPAAIKWWLFAEGTFLFLDGGTLDLGVVRDSSLINTNDYRTFVETFEGVAFVGIESLQVTTTSNIGLAPVTYTNAATGSTTTVFAP
jgi:hypothetical protein